MSTITERAAAALALLPDEMQEHAVAHLKEQAEKLLVLKRLVNDGIADVEAGRVSPFDMSEIRAMAQQMSEKKAASGG